MWNVVRGVAAVSAETIFLFPFRYTPFPFPLIPFAAEIKKQIFKCLISYFIAGYEMYKLYKTTVSL